MTKALGSYFRFGSQDFLEVTFKLRSEEYNYAKTRVVGKGSNSCEGLNLERACLSKTPNELTNEMVA